DFSYLTRSLPCIKYVLMSIPHALAVARDTPGVGDRGTISGHRKCGSAGGEQGTRPEGTARVEEPSQMRSSKSITPPGAADYLTIYQGSGSKSGSRNGIFFS
ncbi:hypothetical protein SFRURICE_013964, partial [Spodoptera frugiperda]